MDHSEDIWVLSIDGGGIRGLISAEILAWLETEIGQPISSCFDLIAGTSSGSVIAGGLAIGPDGNQLVAASDLPEFFTQDGPSIFRPKPFPVVSAIRWLLGPKHNIDDLRTVLERQAGDLMLSQIRNNILLTAYDMRLGRPVLFQSWLAGGREHQADMNRRSGRGLMEFCPTQCSGDREDFRLVDAMLASTSVPTYFAPVRIPRNDDEHYALIDGFVFAINPVVSAYFAARRLYGPSRKVKILSVGTGKYERQYNYDMIKGWGAAKWLQPMLQVFPDGMSDASETYMQWMSEVADVEYFRLSAVFDMERRSENPSPDMDDASPDNLRKLSETGKQLIEENKEILRAIAQQLSMNEPVATSEVATG
ncbi:MAG: patatin-like phospholipase family protein [Hyphomicrobiales bacterium]|nr:patatin-like phospholipase family protein [Hyphomicrobiales bacterium]